MPEQSPQLSHAFFKGVSFKELFACINAIDDVADHKEIEAAVESTKKLEDIVNEHRTTL